jgi:hypothetical protein
MKYHKSLFVLIAPVFVCSIIRENIKLRPTKAFDTDAAITSHLKDGYLSAYEVLFDFSGEIYPYGDSSSVPSRKKGSVTLKGILEGNENEPADEDITYHGTLELIIDMPFWGVKETRDGDDWCAINVMGHGLVKTEMEIYADNRGGYIKFSDTTSQGFAKTVSGSCDTAWTDGEYRNVPLNSITSVFNGLELSMLSRFRKLGDLRLNQEYGDTGPTSKVILKVLKKIR